MMKTIEARLATYAKSVHDKHASYEYFEVPEKDVPYQKHWRQKMMVSFSGRETYQLAKPLADYQNKSVYVAKLEIGQLKWWDYEYLVNLLSLVDPDYSKKVDFQFEVIWYGGRSSYDQSNDPEYEKQLLAWGDELVKCGDSSKINEEKYPALNHEIPSEVMTRETNEALNQFASEFIEWLKAHADFQIVIVVFWRICASRMAKYSISVDADLYSKQMKHASRALLHHNWNALKNELMNIPSWWD